MSDDKKLAAWCYLRAGISLADFPAHWKLDSRAHHGDLTAAARKAYRAIWRSMRAV